MCLKTSLSFWKVDLGLLYLQCWAGKVLWKTIDCEKNAKATATFAHIRPLGCDDNQLCLY